MEALELAEVVDHVLAQEAVDVVGAEFAKTRAIQALKGGPRFEAVLRGELLALLLDDIFVLANSLEQLVDLVLS